MHIVIMGCGRVGSQLANTLDSMGRDVTVIDQEAGAFRRLRHGFAGKTIEAVGFDKEAMVEADIEHAAAFAAVSSGDNSNIIAARVAREIFNVPTVVARIYDPRRAEIYERLGIPTVATVAWTTGQILRRIDPAGAMEEWRDSTGTMMLAELDYDDSWIGHPAASITGGTIARVAFLTRYGEALLIDPSTVLQEGDLLHVLCHPSDKDRLVKVAANVPGSN
ncbi:MAG: TrkA family potassium uptake protein [Candidatus Nanopelagicales bacterium]|nr:TrkA family potassium uptake protein [Candidatus Nanopelagicales bacterium]